jgi:hypothetical protein
MDRTAIDGLKQALAVSPDNLPLRMLLVRALFDAGAAAEAADQLRKVTAEALAPPDRALAGRVHLAVDDAAAALVLCTGSSAEELLVRARAHLALEQHRDGLVAYDKALAANPALEDRELRNQLTAGLTETAPAGAGNVVSFSVIRNEAREKRAPADAAAAFLEPQQSRITFADVGGLEEEKKQIRRRIILPFQKPSLFQKFGRRAGGGVLLYGPPGCGKTLLARHGRRVRRQVLQHRDLGHPGHVVRGRAQAHGRVRAGAARRPPCCSSTSSRRWPASGNTRPTARPPAWSANSSRPPTASPPTTARC